MTKKHNLPKISDIKNLIKTGLDNNPILKYIVGSHSVNGNLRDLQLSNDPVSQLQERNYYYRNSNKPWLSTLSDVDSLRKQIGSLVK
jgi:ribosomal 30S subunit maturation factor RimM